MAVASVVVLIVGSFLTEAALERSRRIFEDDLVTTLEQEMQETGRIARSQVTFFSETHTLFSRTFEGEVAERAASDDLEFYTSGEWPGFRLGGENLLEILHGHASAGIIWLPFVQHSFRDSFESTMQGLRESSFEILGPKNPVEFEVTFDLASLSFDRSSNRSHYYPIAARIMDNGSVRLDMSHRRPLLDTLQLGVDFSHLFSSAEIEKTFENAKETGKAQSTVPFLFGDTTYVLIAEPIYGCSETSNVGERRCPRDSFKGIVGLFLDGNTIVSSIYNIMKSVSIINELALLTEDVTDIEGFVDNEEPDISPEETSTPLMWHDKKYGQGRFVNGFIDNPGDQFKDQVRKLVLVSPGESESFQSYTITDSETATELDNAHALQGYQYEHSFVLNVAGRTYNAKQLILPNSMDQLEKLLDNPVRRTRVIGYTSSVAAALFAALSLFVYHQNRNRLLDKARADAREIAAATTAHERTVNFAQHELRNPLHVIKSSSDEIKERLEQCIGSGNATNMRRLCEGMYEEVGRVTENSQIMNTLVNDMMDLVKLLEGKLDLEISSLDLTRFIEKVGDSHRSFAPVTLYSEISSSLKRVNILTDPMRIRQILANGLTNSSKYCNKGCIHLYCGKVVAKSLEEAVSSIPAQIKMVWDKNSFVKFHNEVPQAKEGSTEWILYRVVDTGEGLGNLNALQLFEPFTQGAIKGSELVPATVSIDDDKYGDIIVPEKEECNDGFSECTLKKQSSSFFRGNSTGSAPNHEDTRELSRAIKGTGLGLSLAKNLAAKVLGGSIDLREERITVSGTEQKKRRVTVFECILPMKVDTNPRDSEPDRIKCTEKHLYKLFKGEMAFQSLRHTISKKGCPTLGIVDDTVSNRKIAQTYFRVLEYDTVCLDDGDKVVPYLQRNGQIDSNDQTRTNEGSEDTSTIDVLFLDISMKRMDGDETCSLLRNFYGISIPIIAMTGNVSTQETDRYERLGFTGVLGKPFDKKTIKELMEKLVFLAMTETH